MRLIEQLLLVADEFGRAINRREPTVSKILFGEGSRLSGLRKGKDMLTGSVESALQTLSDRWPEGAVWPQDVSRPVPRPKDAEPHAESADQCLRRAVSSGSDGEGVFGALPVGPSPRAG